MTSRTASRPTRPGRRLFSIGRWRFQFNEIRILDACLDGVNLCFESFVWLIGPLLIGLALGIVALMVYTFATILVPMIQLKHGNAALPYLVLHSCLVAFFVYNILYNYYFCVRAKHKGPVYDQVVRELAQVCGIVYPETPVQVQQFRADFEDMMVLRLRRQRERDQESGATTRRWMLMGPYEWGFCGNSDQPKPPRSHYDHVSKCLTLNLDHYCPWMFNVVGYFNYRYFVNFLIYIFVGMMYGVIVTWEPFFLLQSEDYRLQVRLEKQTHAIPIRSLPMLPFRHEKTYLTLCFMLCVAVGLAILLLGGFHVYLTLTAQTTIEFHANWANKRRAKKNGTKWKNPYDQGWRKNWQQVYGPGPWWLAILPSSREPDFLPVPVPGQNTLRSTLQSTATTEETLPKEEV